VTAPVKRSVSLVVADDENPVPTPQEAFDHIVRAARQTGYVRSWDRNDNCRYRGPHETRCLVGHILPDSEYVAAFEGHPVEALAVEGIPAGAPFADWGEPTDIGAPLWLLIEMQSCHDEVEPEHWEREFQRIAADAGLEYQAP